MIEITIPQHITHVKLSNSRKAKYYKRGSKMPDKYLNRKVYKFDTKGYLCDPAGERVVANPKSVGTPKLLKINGQSIYSGNMSPIVRSKVVNQIKDSFAPYLKGIEPVSVPVQLEADLYSPVAAKNWDLDNQWIYNKCFLDALVANGIIPDDNIMFVTQAPSLRFFPVDDLEKRKLVYRLKPETRKSILNNTVYRAFHDNLGDSDESLSF